VRSETKRDPPEWEFISLEGELRRKRKFAGDLVLAFAEFPVRFLLAKLDVAVAAGENPNENFCLFAAHFQRRMSAFGGKADTGRPGCDVRF
jgi:hypothetical protein